MIPYANRVKDRFVAREDMRDNVLIVSIVTLIISLIGLVGYLASEMARRRKEIAVRKVFGATVGGILRQFAIEYGLLLVVAAIIAFPVGYVCMKPWVEQFNYQITFAWWIFTTIFVGATLLVALCVGWRVWRSAKARPAEEICKG